MYNADNNSYRKYVRDRQIKIHFAVVDVNEITRPRQKRQQKQTPDICRRHRHKNAECFYELTDISESESDKNYKCTRNEFCGDIQQKRKLRQTDCKTVGYGNRDREYQPQRFCVKPHYPSSQPQNNGVYNHIDKYQNINIDSQAPHPNIFYHGSVEKRVGICNRY